MKFSIKVSSVMWPNPLETADLITFTEEILNGKFQFLYSDRVLSTPLKFVFQLAISTLQILRSTKSCDVSQNRFLL